MSLLSPQLIAFMAVAQHKTVYGAADGLYLTQTAVTQRIKTLEAALKTTLFIRTRRGMKLTPEGEALLRYCQRAKELEGETLAQIQGAGVATEIELTISAPTSITRSRLLPACVPIMKTFPNLLIHFHVEDREHRHQALRAAQADLIILREEHLMPEMTCKKLVAEEYVLVASSAWKDRTLTNIIKNERIIDFDETDQITFDYLKQYDLFSLAQHSRYFVNRTEDLAYMVAQGMGYTTLAKEFVLPYVQSKELIILNKGKTYDLLPILAWFDRPEPPEYFSALIKAIQ